jgi:hypothetical protein
MFTNEEQEALKIIAQTPLTPQELAFMYSHLTNKVIDEPSNSRVYTDDILKRGYERQRVNSL